MRSKRELVLRITGVMILPALWTASADLAMAAKPRAASATVTRTGPAGNTATRQSNVATNGQGGYTAGSTVTGPAGNTATRQQSGSYNPATKTYTRSGTTTGPNGNSVTSTGQAAYNPATGTATQSRTTTGPNGKSATESRTVTVTPTPSN
jgi:hypothetical protein